MMLFAMSDGAITAIVGGLVSIVGTVATVVLAYMQIQTRKSVDQGILRTEVAIDKADQAHAASNEAATVAAATRSEIKEIKVATDGMKSELMRATAKGERAEGKLEGMAEAKLDVPLPVPVDMTVDKMDVKELDAGEKKK